jgi:hypothetical protein
LTQAVTPSGSIRHVDPKIQEIKPVAGLRDRLSAKKPRLPGNGTLRALTGVRFEGKSICKLKGLLREWINFETEFDHEDLHSITSRFGLPRAVFHPADG